MIKGSVRADGASGGARVPSTALERGGGLGDG
jgi:hypothetical protein